MTGNRDSFRDAGDARPDAHDAPDLTRAIMGRLGYMKASPRVVRRRRRRRRCGRVLLSLALLAVIALGLEVRTAGPVGGQPAGPTVPAAIGRDVALHQDRLQRTIQTIRNLVPPAPREPEIDGPEPAIDEDVDRSALGPFRWL